MPSVRSSDLVIQPMPSGELLIYDLCQRKAFSLDPVGATIWKLCDGTRTLPEIASHLSGCELPLETATVGVHNLHAQGLLEEPLQLAVGRREAVRRLVMAAAALPAILFVLSPTAAQASSCITNGNPCTLDTQCCQPGLFCDIILGDPAGTCSNCFLAGTLVAVQGGNFQPIERLRVGDLVLSRSERTGEVAAQAVTVVHTHRVKIAQAAVTLATGESIQTATNHPFRTEEGWMQAGRLRPGISCVTGEGETARVESLTCAPPSLSPCTT